MQKSVSNRVNGYIQRANSCNCSDFA